MKTLRYFVLALLIVLPIKGYAVNPESYERHLLRAIDLLISLDHENATTQLESLTKNYPYSRSGYLLHADILAARGGLTSAIGERMRHLRRDAVSELRQQLRLRWHYWNTIRPSRDDLYPAPLLKLGNNGRRVLYMDIPSARLIVYENDRGKIKELGNFYASIGISGFEKRREGDQKTPIGVYRITGFIPGRKLHERYGPGALPIDYPNDLDQIYERTGSGIWLHGTEPGSVNRAPRASDGCLSLANRDFLSLLRLIGDSSITSVVIDSTPEWIGLAELHNRREALSKTIQLWLTTWLASSASPLTKDLQLVESQLFAYPGENRLYVAYLTLSNGQQMLHSMRQYWRYTIGNEWQIVAEFSNSLDPPRITNNL
uniref:Uncharacterized protein conserved in bacteria n=1 Tax=uncultured gamma proteobacterium HF0200_24F15 TaxID=723570 RepID=E7C3Y9_9GAMM|nr:uncharacterized protein conserved in bacteria [uncultured gamma proteobacterium HF0200_24F15]